MSSSSLVKVDDRDASISYSSTGIWWLGGVSEEYDTTTHGSTPNGTAMSISFSFNGSRVMVYGTVPPATTNNIIPSISYYELDGTTTSTYTAPVTQATLYQQQFYDSGDLLEGTHVVVISPLVTQNSTLWFDYYAYVPLSASTSTTVQPTTTSSSSSAASATSSSPSQIAASKSSGHLVPILAGTLGSVAGIAIIALLALLFRHRRRSYASLSRNLPSSSPPPPSDNRALSLMVEPYHDAPTIPPSFMSTPGNRIINLPTSSSHTMSASVSDTRSSAVSTPVPVTHETMSQILSESLPPTSPPPTFVTVPASPVHIPRGKPARRIHEDAGLRLDGGPLQRIDDPPEYQQYD